MKFRRLLRLSCRALGLVKLEMTSVIWVILPLVRYHSPSYLPFWHQISSFNSKSSFISKYESCLLFYEGKSTTKGILLSTKSRLEETSLGAIFAFEAKIVVMKG